MSSIDAACSPRSPPKCASSFCRRFGPMPSSSSSCDVLRDLARRARMPVIADMISAAYLRPVETLLRAGASDGSLAAVDDVGTAAVALFGAVTVTALMYLVTTGKLDESVIACTVDAVLFTGLRPPMSR